MDLPCLKRMSLDAGTAVELESIAQMLSGDDLAHGWPHVVRVAGYAQLIVEREDLNVDWNALCLAIAFHDVGRLKEFLFGLDHEVYGAYIARKIIESFTGLSNLAEKVSRIILEHSFSSERRPSTLESMILSDADKLDALGAIGVVRVFHTGCITGRSIQESYKHFEDKILKLPNLMHFKTSAELAEKLVKRVRLFMEWLGEEIIEGRSARLNC